MNAKTSAEQSDLEYQYSEDQLTEEPGLEPSIEHESPVAQTKSRFSRKKIIIGIVLCTMVGAVFQFLNMGDKATEGQAEVEQAAKAMQHEKLAAPVREAVKSKVAVEPVVAHQSIAATEVKPATERPMLEQQLNKVALRSTPETNKYEPEIKELQSGLLEVNQSVGGLQKTIESLAASVQSLSNQVEQMGKEQKVAAMTQATPSKPEVKPEYYLKAIITGRAWIESATGDLTTVKVGDELKGYGTISEINPEDAEVVTSDGSVIKHAPNDS